MERSHGGTPLKLFFLNSLFASVILSVGCAAESASEESPGKIAERTQNGVQVDLMGILRSPFPLRMLHYPMTV